MNSLYPFKFKPIYKEKIWGGQQIRTVLGKDFLPLHNCGEMWVLSGVPDNESIVTNGPLAGNNLNELVEVFMGDLLGDVVFDRFGEIFPVLVKFIDTSDYLSVQVHPDDELARKNHGEPFGKTEMWLIVESGKNAELISGFSKDILPEEFRKYLKTNNIRNILNIEKVLPGDVFFIPPGRIHAIGPDILLAEIQQTSDITYRVYDWDRLDVNGLPRELHTEAAMEALDFSKTEQPKSRINRVSNRPSVLVKCPYFSTRFIELNGMLSLEYSDYDSFVTLLCTRGKFSLSGTFETLEICAGEAVLVPALIKDFTVQSEVAADIVEILIDQ